MNRTGRDHRLRARRLKLGVSQYFLGCMAGFVPHNAQGTVSYAEREGAGPVITYKIRSALVYLEGTARRAREAARRDAVEAAAVEEAIACGQWGRVGERMVDLLHEGRTEDFDALAARVPEPITKYASELYVDQCTPRIPGETTC